MISGDFSWFFVGFCGCHPHPPASRMEKNALRAMEAGGRTSVAAAYEAMAAKEAGGGRAGLMLRFRFGNGFHMKNPMGNGWI